MTAGGTEMLRKFKGVCQDLLSESKFNSDWGDSEPISDFWEETAEFSSHGWNIDMESKSESHVLVYQNMCDTLNTDSTTD